MRFFYHITVAVFKYIRLRDAWNCIQTGKLHD